MTAEKSTLTVVDAEGLILGRLSSEVAKRLLQGEKVEVVNCEKAIITGNWDYVFGRYKRRFDMTAKGDPHKSPKQSKMPHLIVGRSVRGMLPWRRETGRKAFRNLKVHIGIPAELQGKNAIKVEAAKASFQKSFCKVGDISKAFGMKW